MGALDIHREKGIVLEEGVPSGHLKGAEGAPESETPYVNKGRLDRDPWVNRYGE